MQINELLLYPTTWMNLANTIQKKTNQVSKSTYYIIPVKQSNKKGNINLWC